LPTATRSDRIRAVLNSKLSCAANRCGKKRAWVSQFCSRHAANLRRYAHVNATALPPGAITILRKRVVDPFLRQYGTQEATLAALDVCTSLVVSPTRGPVPTGGKKLRSNPGKLLWRELQRLASPPPKLRRGAGPESKGQFDLKHSQPGSVTAEEVLSVALAVYLFVETSGGRALPNDGECLNAAIGRAVLLLRQAPVAYAWTGPRSRELVQRKPISGQASKYLGKLLRERLAPFLAQALPLLEQIQDANERSKVKMRTPLVPAANMAAKDKLRPRYPRPVNRSIGDAALIREWEAHEQLWADHPDGKYPVASVSAPSYEP
jgi:hypothetical protein